MATPMFTGRAPETREHYEACQRQQRVDKILKKYGIGAPRAEVVSASSRNWLDFASAN